MTEDGIDSPASPCTKVCRIDAATGYCVGCWRTLAEISAWSKAGDRDKRAILAAVERRRLTQVLPATPD